MFPQNKNIAMKRNIFIIVILASCINSFAQTDTTIKKSVRGFVFIPSYHSDYDYKKCCPGEIIPGYNDYFFPISNPNIKLLTDSNIELAFKNCIRIEKNNFHEKIKEQATRFRSIDTTWNTHWYYLDTFYIVPVIIDYKVFKDDFPKMMSQDSFEMQVTGGAKIFFYPKREAMIPIKIQILSEAILPKRNKNKATQN